MSIPIAVRLFLSSFLLTAVMVLSVDFAVAHNAEDSVGRRTGTGNEFQNAAADGIFRVVRYREIHRKHHHRSQKEGT